MKALRWYAAKDVRLDDVPEPEIAPGMLRTQVEWCGVCGSDLHEFAGGPIAIPVGTPHPTTGVVAPAPIGHEVAERVLEVGDGVVGFEVGDLVVPEAIIGCGECDACRRGLTNMCRTLILHGFAWPTGGFGEREVVPARICHKVPDGVSSEVASMVEPLAVALRSVARAGFTAGQTAVVFGGGPIGLMIMSCLRMAGASLVVAVEPSASRAASTIRAGADVVVDPRNEDVRAIVEELTQGRGSDVTLDAAGVDRSFADALACVKPHGTVVNVASWERPTPLDPMTLIFKEITLTGTLGYVAGDFRFALKLLADGRLDIGWMISRKLRLDEVVSVGYDALMNTDNDLIKVIAAP